MNKFKMVGIKATDRIFERIKSENLPQNATKMLLGLCFVGTENLLSEEFVKGAKRALEIAHEECIREINNICGDKINVS